LGFKIMREVGGKNHSADGSACALRKGSARHFFGVFAVAVAGGMLQTRLYAMVLCGPPKDVKCAQSSNWSKPHCVDGLGGEKFVLARNDEDIDVGSMPETGSAVQRP